jgi:hypothetical protein
MAIGVVVIALTFLALVVGKLVPKRIALVYPDAIASYVARPSPRRSLGRRCWSRIRRAETIASSDIAKKPFKTMSPNTAASCSAWNHRRHASPSAVRGSLWKVRPLSNSARRNICLITRRR